MSPLSKNVLMSSFTTNVLTLDRCPCVPKMSSLSQISSLFKKCLCFKKMSPFPKNVLDSYKCPCFTKIVLDSFKCPHFEKCPFFPQMSPFWSNVLELISSLWFTCVHVFVSFCETLILPEGTKTNKKSERGRVHVLAEREREQGVHDLRTECMFNLKSLQVEFRDKRK